MAYSWYKPFIQDKANYTLYGALFGCLFPLIATPLRAFLTVGELGLDAWIQAQASDPLLWIIDSAPLFLGLFARMAGVRQDAVRAYAVTLEDRVAERTMQLASERDRVSRLMDLLPLAVFEVDAKGRVLGPVSSASSDLLGSDPEGKNVSEILVDTLADTNTQGMQRGAWDLCLGANELQWGLSADDLPAEIHRPNGSGSRILELEYSPIWDTEGIADRILVMARDVTQMRALEVEMRTQRENYLQLEKFLQVSPSDLEKFTERSKASVQAVLERFNNPDESAFELAFRTLHTLKGNSRVLGFYHVATTAHEAEEPLEHLRRGSLDQEWIDLCRFKMESCLNAMDQLRQTYAERFAKILQLETNGTIWIEDEAVNELLERLRQSPKVNRVKLQSELKDLLRSKAVQSIHWKGIPKRLVEEAETNAWKFLSHLSGSAYDDVQEIFMQQWRGLKDVAALLAKPMPVLVPPNLSVLLAHPMAEVLADALGHLLRNAMDHGIEKADERLRLGKPEAGRMFWDLNLVQTEPGVEKPVLSVWDDGAGLSLSALQARWIKLERPGSAPSTDQEWAELLFEGGLSTAQHVSEISGRGVGLDAARAVLAEKGVDLAVVAGVREHDRVPLRFTIALPVHTILVFEGVDQGA